jgi:hypothetical protein
LLDVVAIKSDVVALLPEMIESFAYGVDVPIPTIPVWLIAILVFVVVDVPPVKKYMLRVALLFAINMSLPDPRNCTSPAPPTLYVCGL